MEIIPLAILVVIAGGVGTITGFGTSTIMVPILLLFYPVPQTLLFVGVIHWFGNLWKVLLFRGGIRWRLIIAFGLPGIAASFVGASLVFNVSHALLSRILAIVLIGYVVLLLFKESFKIPEGTATAAAGGAASGFMAGVFGIGGAVRGMFLSAFNLPKSVYIATAGAIAIVVDTTRLIAYVAEGTRLETLLLWGMLVFIPASLVGAKLAKRIVDKIPQHRFRQVIGAFLLAVAIKLLLFPAK